MGCLALVTTHFLELFSLKLLTDGVHGIRAWQMRVQIPGHPFKNDNNDHNDDDYDDPRSGGGGGNTAASNDDAVPLFQLQPGVASSSAGLACAKLAGVKPSVLVRAREIVTQSRAGGQAQPNVVVVEPLLEVLRESFPSDAHRDVLRDFLTVQWDTANEDEAEAFRQRILAL